MNRDLASNAYTAHGISPQSSAGGATVNGTGFEKTGWRWAYVVLLCGAINTNGLTVNVQESSDDGSSDAYANVTGAQFSVTDSDDDTTLVGQVDLDQREQYIRVQGVNGATNASVYGVTVILTAAKDTLLSGPGTGVTSATFSV